MHCSAEATLAISGRLFGVTKKVLAIRSFVESTPWQKAAEGGAHSRLCKRELFREFSLLARSLEPALSLGNDQQPIIQYLEAKQKDIAYATARAHLMAHAAFAGWPKRPREWENFTLT